MVTMNDKFIYGKVLERVVENICRPTLVQYLLQKNGWDCQTFDLIDWDAMEAYQKSISGVQETNVIKLAHNWQRDGHQIELHLLGELPPNCPACSIPKDHLHFFQCDDIIM